MSFPVTVGLNFGDEKVTSTANINGRALGTKGITPDGNIYRWAINGAVALEAGHLVQGVAADVGTDQGQTLVNATVTGVTTISFLVTDTTAFAANAYEDGFFSIDTSPGQANYVIQSHPAGTTSTTEVMQVKLKEVIREPLTSGTSLGSLRPSPFKDVIVAPNTVTANHVGFTTGPVPITNYCWLQTSGWGLVKATNAAFIVNTQIKFLGTSPGEVDIFVATTDSTVGRTEPVVAYATDAGQAANLYTPVKIVLE